VVQTPIAYSDFLITKITAIAKKNLSRLCPINSKLSTGER